MRTSKTKEVTVCDGCDKDVDCSQKCICCKKDFCYECRKSMGIDMPCRVYFTGSGDIFICNVCLNNQSEWSTQMQRLYECYLEIQSVRTEIKDQRRTIDARVMQVDKGAESALKAIKETKANAD